MRAFYCAAGGGFVAIGIIGLFLPLLPTTPFLLLASACFLRGSPRAHAWLRGHPRLGAILRAFEEGRGIPPRAKSVAIALLWVSMAVSIAIVGDPLATAALAIVGLGVTLYLLRL